MSNELPRPVVIDHRYDVKPSMGRGWRAECDCGWLSPTYLTLSATYEVGDIHVDQDMG